METQKQNASDETAQPASIGNIVGHTLVVCGLLVAGTMTLIASGQFASMPSWTNWVVVTTVFGALGGGLSALLASMHAYNYVRRLESPPTDPRKTSQGARKLALRFAEWSFWLALFSTAAAVALTGSFLFARQTHQDAWRGITIEARDGSPLLEVDGNVQHVRVLDRTVCELEVQTDRITIHSRTEGACEPISRAARSN